MEIKGVRWTGFIDGQEDVLDKYNCIVSFEDNRSVYWTMGSVC